MERHLTVIGCGHVGLTWAAVLANSGYQVFAVDSDKKKVRAIKKKRAPFFEPELDNLVKTAIEKGKLKVTHKYSDAVPDSEMVFISVSIPVDKRGHYVVANIENALKNIVRYSNGPLVIVNKSTIPSDYLDRMKKIIGDNRHISLLANPEFLREGSAVFDTIYCDRVVIGGENANAITRLKNVYKKIFGNAKNFKPADFHVTSFEAAEMAKIAANAFLAMKISFANYVSELCCRKNIDSNAVLKAIGADNRIGSAFLNPGIGYGGSCLPKDISGIISISKKSGMDSCLFNAVEKINERQAVIALERIRLMIGKRFKNKKVAFLGLAFKPGTDDLVCSPAMNLLNLLLKQKLTVYAYDPQAVMQAKSVLRNKRLTYCEKIDDVFDGADVIVIATEWKEFIEFNYGSIKQKLSAPNILDCRNALNAKKMRSQGFTIEQI